MSKTITKYVLLNLFIFLVLFVVFYFSAFLFGYGANSNSLKSEIRMFEGFGVTQLLMDLFYIYLKQVKILTSLLALTTIEIIFLWVTLALYLQYFSI